jgi:tetratricopeptide (TPR) repeat protein
LSVYEEHHAKPGWGFNVTPDFLSAFKTDSLVPVSRMNDGFMHPAFPQQVQLSYYQASLVCDLIARDYGEAALVKMLQAYKDGMTTEQVFQRVLNIDIKAFDKKFNDYIRTRFATSLASVGKEPPKDINGQTPIQAVERLAAAKPNDFGTQLFAGEAMIAHNELDKAIPYLEKARDLFPEYGGDHSPYALLATVYAKKNDARKEADVLTKWTSLTETNGKALIRLSQVLEQLGDAKGATDALDRAMFVNPFDPDLHRKLAALAQTAGDKKRTIRERAALVALGPVDKADALYQLALAQHDAGDDVQARKTVLRALEEAPNYEKAQTLLLTIYDARTQGGARKP